MRRIFEGLEMPTAPLDRLIDHRPISETANDRFRVANSSTETVNSIGKNVQNILIRYSILLLFATLL